MLTLFTERMGCCDWSRHRGGGQIKLHKARRGRERKPPDRGPGGVEGRKRRFPRGELLLGGGSAIEHQQRVLVGIARNGRVLHNILYA